MTLMCIDRSQSPTHKGNFLQGRKSPPVSNNNNNNNNNNHNHNNNNNNNNINQQNVTNNNRRNSLSPPLSSKNQQDGGGNVLLKPQHNNPESRKVLERSASEPDRRQVQTNSSRYKTELCRPFEENGTCKYGDKCQFAHGSKELRSMARHPKYKTELCRTFHSTGLCPYGPRCHFIHNSEQSKKSLLTNLTGNGNPLPPLARQKALSSLGSEGNISPPLSLAGTPTVMKTFEDLYQQQPPPLSPDSLAQILVNQNHPGFEFSPVDCFPSNECFPYNLVSEDSVGSGWESYYGILANNGLSRVNPVSDEGGIYLRLPLFDRIQTK